MIAESEQLELLLDTERWPRRPYCSNGFDDGGMRIRSLKSALSHKYIQANPPHLRVWSIYDVDRPGAALAWDDALLPPPAWASINRENGHAHLVWGLKAPVLVEGLGARDAPMRYLCAIESMMREKLKADAGYAGLVTKNPIHPLWKTLKGPQFHYELNDLAEWLPGIEKHIPRRKVEEVGLGRNVTLFDKMRLWAYKNVRQYKLNAKGIADWNAWISRVNTEALVRNGDFLNPLDGREVWHIAKSVATWVWRNFNIEASDSRFSALQAHRVQQRWGNNEEKRVTARLMKASGTSYRTIANELGVALSTVQRWVNE